MVERTRGELDKLFAEIAETSRDDGTYYETLRRHREHELSVVGEVRGEDGGDEYALTLFCQDCGKVLLVAPRP